MPRLTLLLTHMLSLLPFLTPPALTPYLQMDATAEPLDQSTFNIVWFLASSLRPNLLISSLPVRPLTLPAFRQSGDINTHAREKHRQGLHHSLLYILFRRHCQYLVHHNTGYKGHASTLYVVKVIFRSVTRRLDPLPENLL